MSNCLGDWTNCMLTCDDCVTAGQIVFLGPTIHSPRPEYCFEFYHSYLIYVIHYCFQKGLSSLSVPHFLKLPWHWLRLSHPEDAFIDLIVDSILGATIQSIAVKIAFWILSSTVLTILVISLSILSMKHLSKVFTFIVFSLATKSLNCYQKHQR